MRMKYYNYFLNMDLLIELLYLPGNEIRNFYFCIVPPGTALNFLILLCPVFSL